jgi:hypothetical protein
MGDHTETVQVTFDPEVISFSELLEIFWSEHDPSDSVWSRQYMNVIFFENDSQWEVIERSVAGLQEKGVEVKTRVAELDVFYPAEAYHQKHSMRFQRAFIEEFNERDPTGMWFLDSTAAARINGYVAGYGTCEQVEREVRGFGLPRKLEKRLLEMVCSREGRKGVACPVPKG